MHIVPIILLLLPGIAAADGGGPLLLYINGAAFVIGSVFIVLIEWIMYWRFANLPIGKAFGDAFEVNLYSTIVIGFGLPIAIGFLSYAGSLLPSPFEQLFLAMGTWVYDGVKYPKLTYAFTVIWLVVTFVLTVFFEAWLLQRRWERRGASPAISPRALSIRCNAVTYAGLFATFLAAYLLGVFR